jgi:hypothetical protein
VTCNCCSRAGPYRLSRIRPIMTISGLPMVCSYSIHCTKYISFPIKIPINGHYILNFLVCGCLNLPVFAIVANILMIIEFLQHIGPIEYSETLHVFCPLPRLTDQPSIFITSSRLHSIYINCPCGLLLTTESF